MELFDSLVKTSSLTELDLELPIVAESRQKFLRFALGNQNCGLLPLEQIAQVISITLGEILPIPEMPSCILGISNWRGKMLWLIDLNHLVDYPPLLQSKTESNELMVMVIQMNGQFMGLAVQHVNDIELHNVTLQPANSSLFPPRLLPFVQGYLPNAQGLVLNIEAIALCPMWQVHRS